MRRVFVSVVPLACVILLATAPAATATPPGAPIEIKTQVVPTSESALIVKAERDEPSNIYVAGRSVPGQDVQAFTLTPDSKLELGTAATTENPGNIPYNLHRNAIAWIATHYADFGAPSMGLVELRAAAQISIWDLAAEREPSQDPGNVRERARALYKEALAHDSVGPVADFRHVEEAQLTLDEGPKYFDGENLRLHVAASDGDLSKQLVTINGNENQPYQYRIVQDREIASIDIPWDIPGPLTAHWAGRVEPGTFLVADRQYLVLTQALPVVSSFKIDHAEPNILIEGWSALDTGTKRLSGLIGMAFAMGVVICSWLGSKFFRDKVAKAGHYLPGLVVGCVIVGVSLMYCGQAPFHPLGASKPDAAYDASELAYKSAESSSYFSARYAPSCAADGDNRTSWISGRGRGVGETLYLSLSSEAWINHLKITPGAGSSQRAYENDGFPTALQILGGEGQFQEIRLKRSQLGDSYSIDLPNALHATKWVAIRVSGGEPDNFSYAISEISLGWQPLSSGGNQAVQARPIMQSDVVCM